MVLLILMDSGWFWFLSHLGPALPWQEQVGSTLFPTHSGPVPEKLDLNLTNQTGLQTYLLNFKIKPKPLGSGFCGPQA